MNQQVLMMAIPGIIISLLSIVCLWKIFVKAGKPGWFSIIPVFDFITLYQIADAIIVLVVELVAAVVFSRICTIENDICLIGSFVCLFITIVTSFIFPIKLSKKFGKGIGFAILLILFPIIGYPMLAFGKSQYIGKAEPQEDTEEDNQEVLQDENEIKPQDEIEDLDNETEEDLSEFTNENYVPEEDEENNNLPTEEENTEIEDLDDKEFIDPPVTIQDEEEPQVVDIDNEEDNSIEEENDAVDTIEQEEVDEDDEQQDEDSELETKEIDF